MCELSIVIPTCNRNDLLRQAIMSVISQDISNYEILVIDDSTEPVRQSFIDDLQKIAPVRYIINDDNHGAAHARNKGVEHATGKYITFLDDDDLYMPGRLTNMLSFMRTGKYLFVSSGRFYQVDDFSLVQQVPKQLRGEVTFRDIYKANDIDIGFMLEREVFNSLGGFDSSYRNLEDWDFVIRMATLGNGYKCSRLDYCVNVASSRVRVSNDDWIGYSQILDRYESRFGNEWASFIASTILRRKKTSSPWSYIRVAFSYRSFIPIIEFFKMFARAVKSYLDGNNG